jgi:uncharacterized protein with PQ loop repeat
MFKKIIKIERNLKKELVPYIDKLFYLGGILSPLVALPQVTQIFTAKNAAGVSLITWSSYLVASLALVVYGIVHKQKPIIFMNVTVLPVYILIIAGILLYS